MKPRLLCCLLILLLGLPVMAAPPGGKSAQTSALKVDNETYIAANNILMFVTNHGNFGRDLAGVFGNDYGTYFPFTSVEDINEGRTRSPYYAGGLWIGGVDDATNDTLVVISEYSSEYVPGPASGGTFMADNPAFRVYRLYADSMANNPNADYLAWPVDQGAPVDDEGNPELIGDHMYWSVYNDLDPDQHTNMETDPLGIMVKQTVFAFERKSGSLANCVFMRYRIYNVGDKTLDSCFFSLWSDPDLGTAGDDLVGCDTLLDLAFTYNDGPNDALYDGANASRNIPSIGLDFFQGPLIYTGADADTARMWDTIWPGYQNMGLYSFNKYINGTDPDNYAETYAYMKGLQAKETGFPPYVYEGDTLLFQMSGDPVAGTGDLDFASDDRRHMQTTGPITFAPGDSLEILAGMVIGQSGDYLSSITVMKQIDDYAQRLYDNGFNPPRPPAKPIVTTGENDGVITLTWTDTSEVSPGDFSYEGYTVWQGETPAGPWTELATYDVINHRVGAIIDTLTDSYSNLPLPTPMRAVNNTGMQRYYEVTSDKIQGGDLMNLTDYYFKVSAFSFAERVEIVGDDTTYYSEDINGNVIPNGDRFLESETVVTVTPQAPPAGINLVQSALDTVAVQHVSGGSDGNVWPIIMDPRATNGHTYRVTFTDDGEGGVVWTLVDVTDTDTLLADQVNLSGDEDYYTFDGLLIKVASPNLGVVAIDEIADASGPITPDNVMYSLNSTGDWYVESDAGSDFTRMNWRGHIGTYDWEFRFTETGSQYYDWQTDVLQTDRAPFEVWNIGIGTPDDESDDVRINFSYIDDDGNGVWSWSDRIYPWEVAYVEPAPDVPAYTWDDDFYIGRIEFSDNSGALTAPATGTIVRFTTAKVITTEDVYTFTSPMPDLTSSESDLDLIKAVPNPFYLRGPYDPAVGNYQIRFHHLPEKCTITIYNLAGDYIAKIDKDDATPIATWNLQTENRIPVASGIYIYVVDAPGFGQKIGKMAVFYEQEVLQNY